MVTVERWQRIQQLFDDALELPPDRRAAYLAEACRGDEALRNEVTSLLSFDEPADNFLERSAFNSFNACTAEQRTEAAAGRRVGAYEIVHEIGRGGMGAVYLASRADDHYQKQAAIKLIRRDMDSAFILRRFLSERQILARLEHPNIARLLDGGTTDDGLPYFVMEYVEGQPITTYADAHALSTSERLKLFRRVCAAVQYAHQNLIIHRDIKPSNILVTEEGAPKLLDFGIAKLLDTTHTADAPEATATLLRVMTPEYASPEQVKGDQITTASDVYSLGVLLYELLTGHRPYRFNERKAGDVARIICEAEPERPSHAVSRIEGGAVADITSARTAPIKRGSRSEAAHLRRQLRGDLDNIILMALRKVPGRRYPSVSEFSEDVQRHLDGLPVRARKDTFAYRASKFVRRHWAAFLSAAAALLFLVVSITLLGLMQSRRPVASVAVLPFVNVNHNADAEYLAKGITNHLLDRLSEMPNLWVATRTAAARYNAEGPDFDPQSAGRALNAEIVLIGKLDEHDDDLTATIELFDVRQNRDLWSKRYRYSRSDILRLEDDISREVVQKLGLRLSGQDEKLLMRRYTDDVEAYQLYLKGRYFWDRRVEGSLEQSLAYYQQAISKDPNYALAYVGLAQAYDTLGYLTPPSQTYPQAEAAALEALRLDESLPEAHTMLAVLKFKYNWDYEAAEREFRRALQMDPNAARTHMHYAGFLMETRRLDEALVEIDTALRLDPLNLVANANKALILESSRRYAEALEQNRKTLQMEPRLAAAHLNLATILARRQEFVEALDELREGQKAGGGIEYQSVTAYVCALMGNRREAERILADLLRRSRQRYVQPYWIALIYVGLGDKDKAFEFLAKAVAEHSPWVLHLNVAPFFDPLRSDPRFQDLLRRLNLMP